MPLNAGEAADVGKHAAKLLGLPPGDVERADPTRRAAGDAAAVSILADIVFGVDFRQHLVAQKSGVLVGDGIVLDAAHGLGAHRARLNEDVNHHRDFLLVGEIIENNLGAGSAIALDAPLAILPDHQGGRLGGIVLSGNIDPVIALHALVNLARVHDLFRELAFGDAGMFVGVRTERRDIALAADPLSVDHVIKGVGPAGFELAGVSPNAILAALHGAGGLAVDEQGRRFGGLDSEQEVGAIADDGYALLHVVRGELRNIQLGRVRRKTGNCCDEECQETHEYRVKQRQGKSQKALDF